jgi:hypothetical protein
MKTSRLLFTVKPLLETSREIPQQAVLLLLQKAGFNAELAEFSGNSGGRQCIFVIEVTEEESHQVSKATDKINAAIACIGFTTNEVTRALERPMFDVQSCLSNSIDNRTKQFESWLREMKKALEICGN